MSDRQVLLQARDLRARAEEMDPSRDLPRRGRPGEDAQNRYRLRELGGSARATRWRGRGLVLFA